MAYEVDTEEQVWIVKELHYFKYWYVIKSFYSSGGCCFINIKLSELKI